MGRLVLALIAGGLLAAGCGGAGPGPTEGRKEAEAALGVPLPATATNVRFAERDGRALVGFTMPTSALAGWLAGHPLLPRASDLAARPDLLRELSSEGADVPWWTPGKMAQPRCARVTRPDGSTVLLCTDERPVNVTEVLVMAER